MAACVLTYEDVVRELGLTEHPEGGAYRETWRGGQTESPRSRAVGTAMYYLLRGGGKGKLHRVTDSAEIWHWYGGGAVQLTLAPPGAGGNGKNKAGRRVFTLGCDLLAGQRPQCLIPAGWWQQARALAGEWSLCGCTVSPGFEFCGLELADTPLTPVGVPAEYAPPPSDGACSDSDSRASLAALSPRDAPVSPDGECAAAPERPAEVP
eukprot:TRINITY_DN15728_c0_g1_i1.p1 TRINITY_DN15728_c0_g1~~TRINITY_DN15728_c0_g1_i1.p1  ORF type:complete len:228 (+),score=50.02 TRINITY_DN15728_c0_g1_i1:63-686(+)